GHVAPRSLRTLMDLPTWGGCGSVLSRGTPAEVRRSAFRAWSRRALGIVCLDELGHGRTLDPVGVLSARPAVVADKRAVNGGVHEHQGGGYGALGGESRSPALGCGE